MGFIYKITNPSGRLYVGKTYDLRKRINCHKSAAKKRKGDSIILLNSIRKYGWDTHVLEVIEECTDELLNEREIFWIYELKTYCYDYPGQMNMTLGGDGQRSTWMHDKKRRKEQSDKFSGEGNPFYGKTHTEEFKQWMSVHSSERNKKNGTRVPKWGAEKGCNVVRRPVVCYTDKGDLNGEYISLTDAASKLIIKISAVKDSLKYNSWVDGKYLFLYKEGVVLDKIENLPPIKYKTIKRPICWLSEDLEVICEFPSAKEASDFFGIPKTTINRAAQYNDLNPIRTGHIFCYKDEYLKEYCLVA